MNSIYLFLTSLLMICVSPNHIKGRQIIPFGLWPMVIVLSEIDASWINHERFYSRVVFWRDYRRLIRLFRHASESVSAKRSQRVSGMRPWRLQRPIWAYLGVSLDEILLVLHFIVIVKINDERRKKTATVCGEWTACLFTSFWLFIDEILHSFNALSHFVGHQPSQWTVYIQSTSWRRKSASEWKYKAK